jgi:delta 1-pyrroline-5-carboxylate dehydrogenase
MNALNFIGGVFVDAQDEGTLKNINPATGQVIGTIARSKASDVDAAVHAASSAQSDWSRLTMLERAHWLDLLSVNQEILENHFPLPGGLMLNVRLTTSGSLLILHGIKSLKCSK